MSTNDVRQQNVLVLVVVACLALGVIGVGVGLMFFQPAPLEVKVEPPSEPVEPPTGAGAVAVGLVPPLEKPAPAKGGYVGSEKCATCHQEIASQYGTHSMSRSLAAVADAEPIEVYNQPDVAPPGPRRYRAEQRDGKVFHHELMLDQQGEPLYDQEVEIRYVLGSGKRGRSYLLFEQGKFFQSSLGWYSSNDKWDLSPGYSPDQHSRFSRRLGDNCLYCHSGRTSLASTDERYVEPPFLEHSIGCERCHGPGQEHVTLRESGQTVTEALDPIVNPSRLEPPQREDVCNQCHLQGDATILRYGKGHLDFRPGQRLEENWAIFVSVSDDRVATEGTTQAVSQVQQMRSSGCFQASEGKFGCTSCHDPHSLPAPEMRVTFYRDRCLQCHGQSDAQRGCALAEAERLAKSPDDSCIQCHMPRLAAHDVPHTAQTDHRVLRQPVAAEGPVTKSSAPTDYRIFDGAEERMPRREIDRARGLAMLNQPVVMNDPELLRAAQILLAPRLRTIKDRYDDSFLDAMGDDPPALFGLGRSFQMLGDVPRAEACWDAILRTEPNNEGALFWKTLNAQNANEIPRALTLLNRLLALNPLDATLHGQKAYLLAQANQWPGACVAAEQSVRLDPSLLETREFLIQAYGQTGQAELQQEQIDIVRRMKEALSAAGPAAPSPAAPGPATRP